MSHIGKTPIVYPSSVRFNIKEHCIIFAGKYGKKTVFIPNDTKITFEPETNKIFVFSTSKSAWGTTRAHISNAVKGVSQGYVTRLRLEGLGYKVKLNSNILNLKLGFSHDINLEVPFGITAQCPSVTRIDLFGKDIQQVNSFAVKIRNLRPPEPYKGKGVLFLGEKVKKKVLKK